MRWLHGSWRESPVPDPFAASHRGPAFTSVVPILIIVTTWASSKTRTASRSQRTYPRIRGALVCLRDPRAHCWVQHSRWAGSVRSMLEPRQGSVAARDRTTCGEIAQRSEHRTGSEDWCAVRRAVAHPGQHLMQHRVGIDGRYPSQLATSSRCVEQRESEGHVQPPGVHLLQAQVPGRGHQWTQGSRRDVDHACPEGSADPLGRDRRICGQVEGTADPAPERPGDGVCDVVGVHHRQAQTPVQRHDRDMVQDRRRHDRADRRCPRGTRRAPSPSGALRPLMSASWHLRPAAADPGWLDMAFALPLLDTWRLVSELGWVPSVDADAVLREVLAGMRDRASDRTPSPPTPCGARSAARSRRTWSGRAPPRALTGLHIDRTDPPTPDAEPPAMYSVARQTEAPRMRG